MKARIVGFEHVGLELADGLDRFVGDNVGIGIDTCHSLERIDERTRGSTEIRGGLACDHFPIRQHDRAHGSARDLFLEQGCRTRFEIVGTNTCLVHEQLTLFDLILPHAAALDLGSGLVIAAHDLATSSIRTGFVIDDREACHVHAHVGRRLIRAVT